MKGRDTTLKPRVRAAQLKLTAAAQNDLRSLRLILGDLLLIVGQGQRRAQGEDTFYTLTPHPAAPRRWRKLCGYVVRVNNGLIVEVSRYQPAEPSSGEEII